SSPPGHATDGVESQLPRARRRIDLLLERGESGRGPGTALIVHHGLGNRAGTVIDGDQPLLGRVGTDAAVVGAVEEVHRVDGIDERAQVAGGDAQALSPDDPDVGPSFVDGAAVREDRYRVDGARLAGAALPSHLDE